MSIIGTRDFLFEQGGPPPGGMPGAPGGGPPAPPPSDEDELFKKVREYPKVDILIQQMQMKGAADSIILDMIYKKFHPEFVYFAKEILIKKATPKPDAPPAGPGGQGGPPPQGGAEGDMGAGAE